jgi:hypothetical protein
LLFLVPGEEMFRVNEENLLFGQLQLQRYLIVQIWGSHFVGVDCPRSWSGLQCLFHLLDFFINGIKILNAFNARQIFFDEVQTFVGYFTGNQVHKASVVVSSSILLHFWLYRVQTFLQQRAEETIADLNLLLQQYSAFEVFLEY